MTPYEIRERISSRLEGNAHDLWVGYSNETRNEYVIRVQRAGLSDEYGDIDEIEAIAREITEASTNDPR